ncbi:MAG: hypothetical protein CMM00_12385 [Rhodopirellula sp.]|nr:hypothetical protein [Rhodopirellula sp.]
MKPSITSLAFLATFASTALGEDPAFTLHLSGELAGKLSPDTQLCFWNTSADTSNRACYSIRDLPLTLPAEQFSGRQWHINFVSASTRSHFSYTLSRDLFDTPRKIDVRLDVPEGHIRPIFGFARDVRYTALVTQRMRYRSLPCWDNESNTLTKPVIPAMTIRKLDDGTVIHDAEMGDGCMAARWFAYIDRVTSLVDGATYRMTVVYDSGGLFPTQTSNFDFTYHRELHGE